RRTRNFTPRDVHRGVPRSRSRQDATVSGASRPPRSNPTSDPRPTGRPRRSETHERKGIMKVVVIGGTGLIGSKLMTKLRDEGHEAVAASPNSGVNTL